MILFNSIFLGLKYQSTFVLNLLKHRSELFSTNFMRILYCVPEDAAHLHEKYIEKLQKEYKFIEIIKGLPQTNDISDDTLPKLIIMVKYFEFIIRGLFFINTFFCDSFLTKLCSFPLNLCVLFYLLFLIKG